MTYVVEHRASNGTSLSIRHVGPFAERADAYTCASQLESERGGLTDVIEVEPPRSAAADRGRRAVVAAHGGDPDPQDFETFAGDAIADILHAVEADGGSAAYVLQNAEMHFRAEVEGE